MSWLGVVFLVLVIGVMPALAIRSARQLKAGAAKPTIPDILVSTLITQGVMGALAIAAANTSGISLFPRPSVTPAGVGAGVVFLLLALVANLGRWRVLRPEEREELSWLRPQKSSDMALWACIALLAGVFEEVIYRGALYGLLRESLGNAWAATAICIIAFALGHWVQGRGAMLIVVLFAAGFHALVWITGDLYTAIVVHFVYDFVAGVVLWRLARAEGERGGSRSTAEA